MSLSPSVSAAVRAGGDSRTCKVMIVDDSAVVRGLVTRVLSTDPDIEIVGSVSNGEMAVHAAKRTPPDVVVLDIEMPVMDGLTALPLILKAAPGAKVIIASTLTQRNAEISLRALAAGAADYLPKPSTSTVVRAEDFKLDLLRKVRGLGGLDIDSARLRNRLDVPALAPASGTTATAAPIALRPQGGRAPRVLAVGSSTGGPQALTKVMSRIGPLLKMPIFITQHMPPTFTAILADHIAKATGRRLCAEAVDKEPVRHDRIYVAPGDRHMIVEMRDDQLVVRTNQDPPENFCRPAVDVMFRSISHHYGPAVLAVILTGMGSDGLAGSRKIVESGGTLFAQDEASSVVWGMPGAVAKAGLCSAVLPLDKVADRILSFADGGRR